MRAGVAVVAALLAVGLGGCWTAKRKAPKSLPPLTKPQIIVNSPVDLPPEATRPLPIEPPPQPPEPPVLKPEAPPEIDRKPAPPPARPRPRRPSAPPASAPAPTQESQAGEAPVQMVPQLGELISDERRAELRNELEQSLDRARSALNLASQRTLTRRQNETAERVRTFVRQAEDARSRDISTAVQLARRADLLAQDLAATFQ